MATVLVLQGPGHGQWHCLPENRTLVIGRPTAGGCTLGDPALSGHHVEVRCDPRDGRYYAVALQGPAAVRRNGIPMRAFEALDEGDLLELGQTRLLFTRRDFATADQARAFLEASAQWTNAYPGGDASDVSEPVEQNPDVARRFLQFAG
ncbi:MAG: FHA domain-containing protein [Phycisphaeraceae bacterium]